MVVLVCIIFYCLESICLIFIVVEEMEVRFI